MRNVYADLHPRSAEVVDKGSPLWQSPNPRSHSGAMQAQVFPGALLINVQTAVVAMHLSFDILKIALRVCIHRPLEDNI